MSVILGNGIAILLVAGLVGLSLREILKSHKSGGCGGCPGCGGSCASCGKCRHAAECSGTGAKKQQKCQ